MKYLAIMKIEDGHDEMRFENLSWVTQEEKDKFDAFPHTWDIEVPINGCNYDCVAPLAEVKESVTFVPMARKPKSLSFVDDRYGFGTGWKVNQLIEAIQDQLDHNIDSVRY